MRTLREGAEWLNLPLTSGQVEAFERYFETLSAWSGRAGLTGITGREEVQRRHFVESLALGRELEKADALGPRVIDIGSGAGFPGVPLKIVWPHLEVTLLEARRKKATFLNELLSALGLTDVGFVIGRAEDAARDPAHREAYDTVAARAVAPLPVLVELALPFLRLGGYLASPKGSGAPREAEAAKTALEACGGQLVTVEPLALPGAGPQPVLVLVRKVAPTPQRFPRRAGIPSKRPLR
ncbi:MAG: 16S rRNA (guanine(527)-N(7))-methyltransferase RsmG [Chloroflexi bacterium]|nr:16S rRNA (guanine(527)-N(7))-methyltransferase RsmG [Chloroflexota bacterium]